MKELELNLENLLLIGLTPEILKNNFEEWIIENKDIQIDFEKKIIYTGILNFRKELNSFMKIANKELLSEWNNPEELDAFLKSQKEMVKANYIKTMDVFPDDESKQDFLLHILPKIHNQFLENKTKYFDNKYADLINDKELVEKMTNKFQKLNEIKEGTIDNNSASVIDNNASANETYCENLINDPLFSPQNEYMTLKETFIEDIHSRTAHLKDPNDYFLQEFDDDLQEWENTQKEEISKAFLKLMKELNDNKVFFFGCSFDNYKHNYEKRLNEFLKYYTDVSENDFIEDELKFLENILYDIQNSEDAHDGHSNSGYDIFSKAYEFVSVTGYKQYFFSHNKKEAFLNEKKFKLQHEQSVGNSQNNNNQSIETLKNSRVYIQTRKNEENLDEKNANQKNLLQSTVEGENGFKIKVSSKYYALAYIIELLEKGSKPPQDFDGNFKKDEIIKIGRERCNNSGQSFYNCVRDHFELVSSKKIKYSVFKNNWKEIVLNITNNNKKVESYIENNNL